MFKVSGLHSGYDGTIIIEDININVQQDEIVTIIGPNGSGKSTLLKSIFGIVKPQQGKIEFLNEQIIGMKPFRIFEKGISYVPQIENIFSNLTISENLDIQPNLIKIDVDGNELKILNGGRKVFSNNKLRTIIIEMIQNLPNYSGIKRYLKDQGFKLEKKFEENQVWSRT